MLGFLICKWKGHRYRKARKGEDEKRKYCARCPHTAAVRKRKMTEHP